MTACDHIANHDDNMSATPYLFQILSSIVSNDPDPCTLLTPAIIISGFHWQSMNLVSRSRLRWGPFMLQC